MIDDMPPLSVMLTIIQAAMEPWEHGMDYSDVQKLYDRWTEEGGNQMNCFPGVIIPTMAVSGFFTEETGTGNHGGVEDGLKSPSDFLMSYIRGHLTVHFPGSLPDFAANRRYDGKPYPPGRT